MGNPGESDREPGPALADLYHTHYRSLIRLAALLTGDTGTAETVVVDSFVALNRSRKTLRTHDDALPFLRRLVVARSRSAVRRQRPAGARLTPAARTGDRAGGSRQTPFEDSSIVRALRALPPAQREAAVLTLYLDLDDEQAAAAMRVSQDALRRHLDAARAALRRALGWSP